MFFYSVFISLDLLKAYFQKDGSWQEYVILKYQSYKMPIQ